MQFITSKVNVILNLKCHVKLKKSNKKEKIHKSIMRTGKAHKSLGKCTGWLEHLLLAQSK